MKILNKLGLSVAVGLLAAACSSNNSPSSSGSTTGSTSGSGTGSTSGAGTGATSGGTSGSASGASTGATSGTSSGAGTGSTSGSTSGATSGTTPEGGTPEASTEASTTEEAGPTTEAGAETGAALPTVASVQALCTEAASPYQGGSAEFTPQQFCVLFESVCSAEIVPGVYGTTESGCETAFANVPNTATAGMCRTEHLCNANQAGNAATHCPHTQGWGTLTTQAGSPCQ